MTKAELDLVKERIVAMAEAVAKETGVAVEYQVGTMIELPRAALRAGEIAETAEFFSFGTNDLTQTTLGISRDDAASFLGRLHGQRHPASRSLRHHRPGGRRRIDHASPSSAASARATASSSASAASMAAIPPRSISARRPVSTTCPARPIACRSRDLPPPRRRSGQGREPSVRTKMLTTVPAIARPSPTRSTSTSSR